MDGEKNWSAQGVGTKDGDSFMQQKINCSINKGDNTTSFLSVFVCFYLIKAHELRSKGLRWKPVHLLSRVDRNLFSCK